VFCSFVVCGLFEVQHIAVRRFDYCSRCQCKLLTRKRSKEKQAVRYTGEAVTRDNQLTQHGRACTVDFGNFTMHFGTSRLCVEDILCGRYLAWRVSLVEGTFRGMYLAWKVSCAEGILCGRHLSLIVEVICPN
jgi:hypothetical protein